MPDIVGVRFKRAGKVYYFDPAGVEIKVNDHVVVQTARGAELGQVMIASKQVLAAELTADLKPIVRKATGEDVKRAQEFTARENNALAECIKLVTKHNLQMKLVAAEYNLDGSRLTFYFTAEERVDFRELVRELTAFFKTRIELRQIGPRDQAKLVGGLGRCGRALCCGSYLTEFNPVSIKMAKEQDLPLDPMKISGVCGRLQCCLAYENTQYREAKALLPRKGQEVITPNGPGIVTGGNPLKETVLVELESKAAVEFPLSQIKIVSQPAKPKTAETETEDNVEPARPEKIAPVTSPKKANIPPQPVVIKKSDTPAQTALTLPTTTSIEIKPQSLPSLTSESPPSNLENGKQPRPPQPG